VIIPTSPAPSRTKGPSQQGLSPPTARTCRDYPGVGISRITLTSELCDNLSAHKAPVVHRWLLAHLRFVLHFTPACSSWLSQVERWFAELQRRCLERGVFCSLDELTIALENWIKLWNAGARPFTWTKTPDQIIDRICRYCSRISEPAH